MKKHALNMIVGIAACSMVLSGTALAGRGGGRGLPSAAGSQVQTQVETRQQFQNTVRQQLKSGDCGAAGTRQGTGQGSMRRLGPGDGSELAPRPQDGTGFGSPAR